MGDTVSLQHVIDNARKVYADLDPKVQKRAWELGAKCSKGCAACCYQLVGATFAEAFVIAEELGNTLTPKQIDELLVRLDQHSDLLRRPGDARSMMFLEKRRCPFLVLDGDDPFHGSCSVYASRPLVCRLQYVVSDPRLCQPDQIYECVMVDTVEAQLKAMGIVTGENAMLATYAPMQPLVAHALRIAVGKQKRIDEAYLAEWSKIMLGYLDHENVVQIRTGSKDKFAR